MFHLAQKAKGPVTRPLGVFTVVAPAARWGPPPPPGADGAAGPPLSRIERGFRSRLAYQDRNRLVAKNSAARIAVVRGSTLVGPGVDRNPPPPPPPMPRPPPSDFWMSTRPTMATTIIRWIRIMT